MKNKEKIIKEQYEAWASTYDKDKVEIIKSDTGMELGEFVDIILDRCNLQVGQNILDVGIGTGLISMSIAKRLSGKCKILGIDINDMMLKKAKVNIKKESLGDVISLRKASAERIPGADDFYDLIVCVFTIRHTDINDALIEFMRVLKTKGTGVIVDLYAPERWNSLMGRIIMPLFKVFFMRKRKMRAEKESKIFTLGKWEAMVKEIGGKNIQTEKFPNMKEPEWIPGKMIISWNKK